MAVRRKAMHLFDHERKILVKLYLKYKIPIDQFDARPREKAEFIDEWNSKSKRSDSADEVFHYMERQRKSSKWVKLGQHGKRSPPPPELSAEHTEALVDIFTENMTALWVGSDALSHDDEMANLIAKEFELETGTYVEPHVLVTKLKALRKRGLLPKVGDEKREAAERGFDDVAEATAERRRARMPNVDGEARHAHRGFDEVGNATA